MRRASVKNCKFCAFCTPWYDPGNSAIEPLNPGLDLWNYDEEAKSFCACCRK